MKLELPWPPSVNTYWRRAGYTIYISEKGKEYRSFVILFCRAKKIKKTVGKIALTIEAYPPDKRQRDLDNLPKALLDSLVHANVIDDDSNIDELHILRREVIKEGKVVVTIQPILTVSQPL